MDRWRVAAVYLLVAAVLPTASAAQPVFRDDHMVIVSRGDFSDEATDWVRAQFDAGLDALRREGIAIRREKFPVRVILRPGRGVSHSFHGKGPIMLFHVGRRAAPVIHELTHVLAGYTRENGHWSTEGLASYMQDKYSEYPAYPTFRHSHALARLLVDNGDALPMIDVLKDRDREKFFGTGNGWQRWSAYCQATSFARYLIETFGMVSFMKTYDLAFEKAPFAAVYGRSAERLVADWQAALKSMSVDLNEADSIYQRMARFLR